MLDGASTAWPTGCFSTRSSGRVPGGCRCHTAEVAEWDFVEDGDLATIAAPLDLLSVNYYAPVLVAGSGRHGQRGLNDGHGSHQSRHGLAGLRPGAVPEVPGQRTAMGWIIDESGLRELLHRVGREHPGLPMMITENGAAFADRVSVDGAIHDAARIDYLRRHPQHRAIEEGVDVRGYLVWSLLNKNFEWSYGYGKRFGLIAVDYASAGTAAQGQRALVWGVVGGNAVGGT